MDAVLWGRLSETVSESLAVRGEIRAGGVAGRGDLLRFMILIPAV